MIQPSPKSFNAARAVKAAIVVLPGGRTIEVAPGVLATRCIPAPEESIPRIGVFRWQAVGDDTYRATLRVHSLYLKVPLAVEAFGLENEGRAGEALLRRLIRAQFVKGRASTPRRWEVDIVSLSQHLEAVEADPDFWTPERVKQFADAL